MGVTGTRDTTRTPRPRPADGPGSPTAQRLSQPTRRDAAHPGGPLSAAGSAPTWMYAIFRGARSGGVGGGGASRRSAPLRSAPPAPQYAPRCGTAPGGGREGTGTRLRRSAAAQGSAGAGGPAAPPHTHPPTHTHSGGWRRLRAGRIPPCPALPCPRSLRGAATGPPQRGQTLTSRGPGAEIQGWKALLAPRGGGGGGRQTAGGGAARPPRSRRREERRQGRGERRPCLRKRFF